MCKWEGIHMQTQVVWVRFCQSLQTMWPWLQASCFSEPLVFRHLYRSEFLHPPNSRLKNILGQLLQETDSERDLLARVFRKNALQNTGLGQGGGWKKQAWAEGENGLQWIATVFSWCHGSSRVGITLQSCLRWRQGVRTWTPHWTAMLWGLHLG